eukprot:gnl/MRDRNA2_/MRDRNA2_50833_c0_seq1.p1 gnl/MRDRNA2_/MRDRNA2_50833_c0~~gnl/MRDRNA2_/MRDRNA2_50833_c0_seq1.p1  ORF type:complete len:340 (-),score=32.24 gnl/MRDRNA2_/MRDRNA2_50833_c0_seq1:90-1109(-)
MLKVTNYACESPHSIEVNEDPMQVGNGFFDGQVLCINRTDEGIPFRYEEQLDGTRRRCEFQFQCQFKEPLQGILWMGSEIMGPLSLNFFTRRIVDILLAMMQHLVGPGIQYSTGIDDSTSKVAFMHYPAVDCLSVIIATPSGEQAPVLGSRELSLCKNTSFEEKSAIQDLMMSPTCKDFTFTFTFKSMYIDVLKWSVVNIPGVPSISFETFWGSNKAFRLLVYIGGKEGPRSTRKAQNLLDILVSRETGNTPEDTDDWGDRTPLPLPLSLRRPASWQSEDWETESFFSCFESEMGPTPRGRKPMLFKRAWFSGPLNCVGGLVSKFCSRPRVRSSSGSPL